MCTYVVGYYRYLGSNVTVEEFYIVLPSIMILSIFTFPVCMWLCPKIGVKVGFTIGGTLTTLAIFASSYTTNATGFYFSFVFLFTIGKGFIFTGSLYAGWSHLPKRKGLVSGICVAGNGIGGLFWSLI